VIRIEDRNSSRVITLARAEKHNALGVQDYELLTEAFQSLADRADISSVQILAEGKTFCAGNNLAEFETEWPQPDHGPVFRFFDALASIQVPLLAGVQGGAVGVGATLLLHCDIVLMTENAWLRFPFVPLGIAPEGGSTRLLPLRIGHARAMDILLSGRKVQAQEAVSLGLGSALVSADALAAEMKAWGERISTLSRDAVIETKRLLRRGAGQTLSELFEVEVQAINRLIVSRRETT
jgi:enoyl-CoA hydratase/carnithine racemase